MGVRAIKRVLRVSTSRNDRTLAICSAIRQLHPIEYYYHGGYRTVEPFALGMVLNNREMNESLFCYQTGGYSELRDAVGWKLYRVSDMEEIEVLKDTFTGDRPGYDPENLEMVKVICCVRSAFKGEKEVKEPPKKELIIETSPVPPYRPPKEELKIEPPPIPLSKPPEKPEVKIQPVIRYITHNELMKRFRCAHPTPIPELDTTLWPEPLAVPFQESVESKIRPETPVSGKTRYLVGQTA